MKQLPFNPTKFVSFKVFLSLILSNIFNYRGNHTILAETKLEISWSFSTNARNIKLGMQTKFCMLNYFKLQIFEKVDECVDLPKQGNKKVHAQIR